MSRRILAPLVIAVLLLSRTARAGDAQEQQLAQALFDEARGLMDKKRYGEACPKLVESQRLDPGGGTLLNIAVCHEKEGKLATAKVDFEEALAVATRDGRKDRQKIARERLAAIEPAIPRLRVVVPPASDIEGLEVKLDGLVLRRAAWGTATPVDAGSHVVEATATGRTPWSMQVVLGASQKKFVDVPTLAGLSDLPQPAGQIMIQRPMILTSADVVPGTPETVDLVAAAPAGRPSPVFYGVLTATLLAAGTSAVTGVLAFAANREAKDSCLPDRKYCRDQAGTDAADRASTYGWVSTFTLGVAAIGFIGVLAIPSRTAGEPAVRASALPGGAAFDLAGTF